MTAFALIALAYYLIGVALWAVARWSDRKWPREDSTGPILLVPSVTLWPVIVYRTWQHCRAEEAPPA